MTSLIKIVKRVLLFLTIVFILLIVLRYYWVWKSKAPSLYGTVEQNIEYKDNLFLDIYHPTKYIYDKSPVILYIHGGAFITGRKESINFNRVNKAINKLRASGYTILSANYTVASPGKSPFPYCIQDCFHMIQWIEKNAETKAWDLFNFGVIGESAGGHLALMTGFTSPKDFSLKIEVRKPKYIVDLYGPNNMFEMFLYHSDSATIRKMSFFSKFIFKHADLTKKLLEFDPMSNLKKVQEITELFSPINYLSSFAPPTLIIHGTADEAVPVSQSKNLKFKLDQLNVPNDILLLEGVNHGFWGASSEQREAVQNKISNFIMNQYQKN